MIAYQGTEHGKVCTYKTGLTFIYPTLPPRSNN